MIAVIGEVDHSRRLVARVARRFLEVDEWSEVDLDLADATIADLDVAQYVAIAVARDIRRIQPILHSGHFESMRLRQGSNALLDDFQRVAL